MLALCDCSGFVQLNTNLPLYSSKVIFVNDYPDTLDFLIDGEMKAMNVLPTEIKTFGYWVGGGAYQSQVQVSVTILDRKRNCSWSDVIYFSSYYPYKYVFTARKDENGKLQVERR
jgi:hypothetical protein